MELDPDVAEKVKDLTLQAFNVSYLKPFLSPSRDLSGILVVLEPSDC